MSILTSSKNLKGYSYILPALIFFAVFLVYPIIFSFALSFFEWTGFTKNPFTAFIGLENYISLTKDPIFLMSLRNTFVFVITTLVLQNIFGLGIALFVFYGKVKASTVWRAIVFIPILFSSVVVGLVWRQIFLYEGLLNQILTLLRLDMLAIPWLGNLVTPIFVISIVSIWQSTGFNMILYYAAIMNIDNEQIESAMVDGASWMQIITKIVIPQLFTTISVVVILNIIGGFKVFDLVFVMTKGGPLHASEVLTSFMYNQLFGLHGINKMGYGSAIAIVLFLIVLTFTIIRIFINRKVLRIRQ